MAHAEGAKLAVTVSYSPRPGEVDQTALELPAGASVLDALHASGLAARHPAVGFMTLKFGVWGKPREASDLLRDQDRVEFWRPLQVDPKEARRLRYRQHRERFGGK